MRDSEIEQQDSGGQTRKWHQVTGVMFVEGSVCWMLSQGRKVVSGAWPGLQI
jgi:hypothetical protein